MAAVILCAAYFWYRDFLGAGKSGNYLRIRKPKDSSEQYCYRILPVYKLILRRMKVLYVIMLFLHITLPLFYAFVFSVLILISKDIKWWSEDSHGIKESVLSAWLSQGYRITVLLGIFLVAEAVLFLINIFVFPLVFNFVSGMV